MTDFDPPVDPEVAELLSALLDGAVTAEERALAEDWLARSAAARAEYESLAQVKAAVGGMGEVEAPFGFYDRMLRQGTPLPRVTSAVDRASGRRRRSGAVPVLASLVASAAAFVLVAGPAAGDRAIDPPVEAVAAGTADGTFALRSDDGLTISALRQEAGGVAWEQLPRGERLDEGGVRRWRDLTTTGDDERVVVVGEGVVVTLAAKGVEPGELLERATLLVHDEPAAEGFLEDARRACEGFLRSLAVG